MEKTGRSLQNIGIAFRMLSALFGIFSKTNVAPCALILSFKHTGVSVSAIRIFLKALSGYYLYVQEVIAKGRAELA